MTEFYCKITDIPECDNYVDFINKFIELNPSTYYYYDNHALQCGYGRRRSFSDIHIITKQRYPDVTLEQVISAVAKNIIADRFKLITFCSTIKKLVITRVGGMQYDFTNQLLYINAKSITKSDDSITSEQINKIIENEGILL